MPPVVVGVIGGSALADEFRLEEEHVEFLVTSHGAPSDPPRVGRVGDRPVVFLPRHGRDHRIPPHKLNHRANLSALKELGATHILSTASSGSLKRAIRPGHLVVPHDFVSFWTIPTFHDDRTVHVTPVLDEALRAVLVRAARLEGATARDGGVYVQTTGPRLETPAEIAFFRKIADLVGMTMASEATLASELGIPYACVCTVDNYCNGIVDEPLTFEKIREMQIRNADLVRKTVVHAVGLVP